MKASTSAGEGENRLICLVCRKQFSHYTCPRCNVRYCSLPCYRSHSDRCLESFNRDNVLANLQDCTATPDTRKRMLKALQRFHSSDAMDVQHAGMDCDGGDDDDGDDEDAPGRRTCILSENTLNKLVSGEDIELSDLSPEEKRAFLRAVTSGEFSHMIKPWEPWWLSPFVKKIVLNKDGNRAVQTVEHSDMLETDRDDVFDVPPPWDSPLPPLRHLTPKPPSPLLGVHLAEVLYSYCFTLRFFNGDWTCDAFQAAWACSSVSHVLGQSTSPQTVSEALNSCFETICSPFFKSAGGYKFALALLDDAIALLHAGRPAVICALSDLHRMFEKAAKDAKQGDGNPAIKKGHQKLALPMGVRKTKASSSSDLKAVCKKIFFLLCWANEQPAEVFSALALVVEKEKAQILDTHELSVLTSDRKAHSESSTRKPLVEEITGEP
eukprot:c14786_g1_i1 orf=269-1579(-)